MATKISITKKLEGRLREAALTYGPKDPLSDVVALIDAANSVQSSKASDAGSGLTVAKFVNALQEHRPVVLPPDGPIAGRIYARFAKCLRDNGVTEEQAAALGLWLAGPGMRAVPGEVTIDRIIKNLGDWVTRAVANKPQWEAPEW